ncbi:MAG: CmpA/NrtA family ABC transporter substrate-binding protein [Thiogranum sp.]|nr:CmpA/NrtA family ABC transporter substrate-binding protein [Thiogranum sp.]
MVRFLHERHAFPTPVPDASDQDESRVLDLRVYKKTRRAAGLKPEKTQLNIGFIPLTDCAPLVVAKEQGLFGKYGLDVTLSRESSWANIRDKLSYGLLDGAQMLAAMPLASTAQAGGKPMVAAMSLDLNGNAISVSRSLYARLQATGQQDLHTPLGSARALRRIIDEDRADGAAPLTFAMVFPESSHNYLLRYWMASAGIDPDQDVRLIVVPPPQMVSHLEQGLISGFCVGEPWNAHAVRQGAGHTLITSYDVWNNHPEKVFGVTRDWADQHPDSLQALLMALLEACAWLDTEDHRREVCTLLSQPGYVDCPEQELRMSMTGTFQFNPDGAPESRPDFNVFHRYAANYPWRSHALWTLSQMLRWGHIGQTLDLEAIATQVYRPDLYRKAAAALGYPLIAIEHKCEGEHQGPWVLHDGEARIPMGADAFMDGRRFDPADVIGYLSGCNPVANERRFSPGVKA